MFALILFADIYVQFH